MCVAALAIGYSPRWPLALVSNRDEFLDRPTAALQHWHSRNGTPILSGRDLRDGGTWLGFTPTRAALLTNVREHPLEPGPRSRGELAVRWLSATSDAAGFCASLRLPDYGGFNLVLGDWGQPGPPAWHYLSNRGAQSLQALGPGIYGLSNAGLDTPWPKTLRVKQLLGQHLSDDDNPLPLETLQETLLQVLQDTTLAPDAQLPATGVPLDIERALSATFVQMPQRRYGTQCSTVALLGREPQGVAGLSVTERSHTAPGQTLTAWLETAPESAP